MKRRGGGNHPAPGLPRVNLLSQGDLDRIAVRRLRKSFVVGAVVMVMAVGAGWFVQHQRVNDAQKLVTVEQAETARLSEQSQQLAKIKVFVAGVQGQKQTVAATMSQEIYFSRVLAGIRAVSPLGTSLQSINVTLAQIPTGTAAAPSTADSSICPGPDPFRTETLVGCVTLSGTAVSRDEVGQLVTNLGDSDLFVVPFISTTTTGDSQAVTFSGSVGLSEKVYSHRYGPIPTATPTPAPTAAGGATDEAAAAAGGAS